MEEISLRIHDNGQGYDVAQKHAGLGIGGMQERLTLLNGSLKIVSQPGQGTTVSARLPLRPAIEQSAFQKEEHYA